MKIFTTTLRNSIGTRTITVGVAVVIVLMGVVAPVTAHSWQETVQDGDHELGIDTGSTEPAVGVPTEFTGHIVNTTATEGAGGHHGGVVNETVVVTITGPNEYHDRLETTISKDDPYFEFSHVFPTDGEYEINIQTTIDGEEVGFQFIQEVSPSTGAETKQTNSTNNGNTGIDDNIVVLGLLSGTSALFALSAFGAAVMAYRGTD